MSVKLTSWILINITTFSLIMSQLCRQCDRMARYGYDLAFVCRLHKLNDMRIIEDSILCTSERCYATASHGYANMTKCSKHACRDMGNLKVVSPKSVNDSKKKRSPDYEPCLGPIRASKRKRIIKDYDEDRFILDMFAEDLVASSAALATSTSLPYEFEPLFM